MMDAGIAAVPGSQQEDTRQTLWKRMVDRMAQGDHSALSDLYDQSCGILHALALRILRNKEDAEETLHDAYLRAWRYASAYSDQRGSVLSWLVLMTRTSAIDRLRAAKRHSTAFRLDEHHDAESPLASPEHQVVSDQKAHRIRIALRDLSAEQREAIELAFFSGLSHSELAEHLGVPLGTIKTRIRAGLQRMRGALEDLGI